MRNIDKKIKKVELEKNDSLISILCYFFSFSVGTLLVTLFFKYNPQVNLGNLLDYFNALSMPLICLTSTGIRSVMSEIFKFKSLSKQKEHLLKVDRGKLDNSDSINKKRKEKLAELYEKNNELEEGIDKKKVAHDVLLLVSLLISAIGLFNGISIPVLALNFATIVTTLGLDLFIVADSKDLNEIEKRIVNINNNIELSGGYELDYKRDFSKVSNYAYANDPSYSDSKVKQYVKKM